MPSLLIYLASGFVFLQVFNFVVSNRNPNDYKHTMIKSLLSGYVLSLFYNLLPYHLENVYADNGILLTLCVVLGYLLARLYCSNLLRTVCRVLRIKRTVNEYIWYDIADKKYPLWVRTVNKALDIEYMGQLTLTEDF